MYEELRNHLGLCQNDQRSLSGKELTSEEISPHSAELVGTVSKPPASHLKLVVSTDTRNDLNASMLSSKSANSEAILTPVYKSAPSLENYFTAEVRKRSPYDFVMVARDPFHYLHCELPLKFVENQGKGKRSFMLICQFPTICEEELIDFIEDDEDLLGMTLISFQMQILKNLFVFCSADKVENLIIKVTEEQFAALGIYEEFIKYVDKTPTNQGMDVEIIIPVHANPPIECEEFIDNMMAQFRKTLWKKQSTNSAIRNYLKANVRLSIITEASGRLS